MSRLLAAVACVGALWAQSQVATLEGVLTDPAGAVVSGAAVIATDESTRKESRVLSGPDGRYAMALPAGEYRVRAEAQGFRIEVRYVKLIAGARVKQDFTLQVGSVAETVVVTGDSHRGWRGGRHRSVPPPRQQWNSEEYAASKEEGFQTVGQRPLSTFSADVDTASYSNVRRFLTQGQLPPADAVRVEEMLNYFRYDGYREPDEGKPVGVKTELAECPWNRSNMLALIGLRTRSLSQEQLPPSNLVFLIDVSGSMSDENKLPLLKQSFALLTRQLRPQDRVAIVVYAGAAGLVLPSTPGSEKQRILSALDSLQAGGSTAGAQGIRLAYEVARANFRSPGNNRVVLATDGDFNVGVSSETDLVRLIEREREHGVFLTVLGFGYGNIKDNKLEKLADHGNGNYAYIDSLREAHKVLVREMGATLVTVAKDVKFQVEFNPEHVREWRLVGYENRRLADEDFKDDRKDAGDLGAGHQVTALYELVPAKGARGVERLKYQQLPAKVDRSYSGEAFTVKIRYKQPRDRRSMEMEHAASWAPAPIDQASEDLRFAAGVAEFGMVLRDSAYKGSASLRSATALVGGAIGADLDGGRAELVDLIRRARELSKESH